MVWQIVGETAETVFGIVGNVRRLRIIIVMCSIVLVRQYFITDYFKERTMILIILIFILFMLIWIWTLVLMDGHKFFLLYRVKLAMVSHTYRFCVNVRKGRQERYGKILFLLCEAEASKSCNLCRKFGTISIFTILDEGLQFIYYSGVQRNNGIRWKVMQNSKL